MAVGATYVAPVNEQSLKERGLKLDFDVLHGDSIDLPSRDKRGGITKRDGPVSIQFEKSGIYYQASIFLGSNREESKVLVDTGSSSLWVMSSKVSCQWDVDSKLYWGSDPLDDSTDSEDLATGTDYDGDYYTGTDFDGDYYTGTEYDGDYYTGTEYDGDYYTGTDNYEDYYRTHIYEDLYTKSENQYPCTASGSFHTAGSDTFIQNETMPDFKAYSYFYNAFGVFGTDTVGFADTELNMSFGVATSATQQLGVLGLSRVFGESSGDISEQEKSSNFPTQLKEAGVIDKRVYSLFLNKNSTGGTGSVFFGAVDHKKYQGQLQTVPAVNASGEVDFTDIMMIVLDRIYLEGDQQNITLLDEPVAAWFESSSTFQVLPRQVMKPLVSKFQGNFSSDLGLYEIGCEHKNDSSNIVYDFSGIQIKVTVSDLVHESEDACYLGAYFGEQVESNPVMIKLGNNFLQNAYMVFDLDDLEVSMAQANYTDEEDVEEIISDIPSASQAPRYSSTSLVTYYNTTPSSSGSQAHTFGSGSGSSLATHGPSSSSTTEAF